MSHNGENGHGAGELAEHIVVVGGGIAGLYTAWRLSDPEQRRSRALRSTPLEVSERLGGRIHSASFTEKIPFKAELGAMRFPLRHRLLCGEAYSNEQGGGEGSFKSVENMLLYVEAPHEPHYPARLTRYRRGCSQVHREHKEDNLAEESPPAETTLE